MAPFPIPSIQMLLLLSLNNDLPLAKTMHVSVLTLVVENPGILDASSGTCNARLRLKSVEV